MCLKGHEEQGNRLAQAARKLIQALQEDAKPGFGVNEAAACRQLSEAMLFLLHDQLNRLGRAMPKVLDLIEEIFPDTGNELGCGRGGSGSYVRHKIGNSEIYLVSHRGDDRFLGLKYSASNPFLIESPEVFRRSATSSQNDGVDLGLGIQESDSCTDFLRGCSSLNRYRKDQDVESIIATLEYSQNVLHCCPGWGGDYSYSGGKKGKGFLVGYVEQTLLL